MPGARRLISIAAVSIVILLLGWAVYQDQFIGGTDPVEKPAVGYRAPDFGGIDVATGQTVSLADLKGKPVLLNFWATWCPPCREEMPALDKLSRDYKDKVFVIALGADPGESAELLSDYAKRNNLASLTILRDSAGSAARRYGIRAIPTSFFIDAQGTIREVRLGAMSYEAMVQGLQKAGVR